LESIHDNIHVLVGGNNGNMSVVPVAAFDPIFFLHHCQVDRLLALWASVHPDVWVPPSEATTNLTPFWNAPTTFWASTTVRDFGNALNYTYPDFLGQDDTVSAAAVSSGPATQALFAQPAAPQAAVAQAAAAASHAAAAAAVPGHSAAPGHSAGDPAPVTHWTARIRFKQYEIGGSFSVLLYLNAVPTNPEEYYTSPNYAGAYHGFVNIASENCTNCQNQAETGVEGYVHINDAILQHAHQTSLDPAVVVPYLTKNLHWRVVKLDGTVAELPSLEVVVLSTPVTLHPGAKYPVVGEPVHYHGITHGRTGGSRHALVPGTN
jgi:tyrosinase